MMKETIEMLHKKYSRYIENLKWHLKTNKPTDPNEIRLIKRCIDDYEEIKADLNGLYNDFMNSTLTNQ